MGANAQTSVPAFTAGQVLTAQQQTEINTGVPVFATTTTRDAAFGGSGEKVLAEGQLAYIEASDVVQYYNGTTWLTLAPQEQAIFNETQASGTNGGASTTAFKKRTLNTTVLNTLTGCSISSSVITLANAGTYYFRGSTPGYECFGIKSKIRNTTAGTDVGIGQNVACSVGTSPGGTSSIVECVVTITASTNFELQSRETDVKATNGLGGAYSMGVSEIYSQLYIERIG